MKTTTILFALLMINITMASDGSSLLDNSRQLESAEEGNIPYFTVTDELKAQVLLDDGIHQEKGNVTYTPVANVGTVDENEKELDKKALESMSEEEVNTIVRDALDTAVRQIENPKSVAQADSKMFYKGCYIYSTPCACSPNNACCIVHSFKLFYMKLYGFYLQFFTWRCPPRDAEIRRIMRLRYLNTCGYQDSAYLEMYMTSFLRDKCRLQYGQ